VAALPTQILGAAQSGERGSHVTTVIPMEIPVPSKFGRTPDGAKSGPLRRTWGPDAEQDVFRRLATSVNVPPRLSSLGPMNTLASWAEQLAQVLLQESLPRRWAHVQGVAARARSLAPVLGADADLLEAAAWLHDIGYAPGLATTGLHALDGARYLRDTQHAGTMLCRLVAHHTCAIVEAEERGLADILGLEFEPAPHALSNVLTYCDITTSPDGELVTAEQRLAEIQQRYGPGHLASQSMQRATPMILRAVEQVQDRAARSM
jgi:hypothetical protein